MVRPNIEALTCQDLELLNDIGNSALLTAAIARDASGCANNKMNEEMQMEIGHLVREKAAEYGNHAILFATRL